MKILITAAVTAAALAWTAEPSWAQGPQYSDRALAGSVAGGTGDFVHMDAVPAAPAPDESGFQYDYAGYSADTEAALSEATADAGRGGSCCEEQPCGHCDSCCVPFWEHRSAIFGDFLYLRPRGVDVAYALPRSGIDPLTSVPFGPVAVASPDYQPGFRLGLNRATSRCSSLAVAYTYYQGETDDAIAVNAPLVLHSLVTHPNTASAAADSLLALAHYDIRFQLLDVDYRRLLCGGRNYAVNYSLGTRYGHSDQIFRSAQPISPGLTNVASDITFDGFGTRVGLEAERKARNRGWLIYAKGFASVLVGEFDSSYLQFNNFQQTLATTSWEDSRAVPILEYELGIGWQNARGNLRLSAGHQLTAWFNTVSTPEYIQAVQTNDYVDLEDTITFDGIAARAELRW